jgi:hypothetical protein
MVWQLPVASEYPLIHSVGFAPSNIRDQSLSINIKFVVPFRPFSLAPSNVRPAESGMMIPECFCHLGKYFRDMAACVLHRPSARIFIILCFQ